MDVPKPDPIIIRPVTPVTPTPVITQPVVPIIPSELSAMDKLKDFVKKNKKLSIAIGVLTAALLVTLLIIALTSSQRSKIEVTPTPIVSAPLTPVSRPTTITPATPIAPTTKTLTFTQDSVLNVNDPITTLSGTIIVDSAVTMSQPNKYNIVFKKGTSSFTITNFYEEYDHDLIDAEFIGTTKSLGNTYRVSQNSTVNGETEYFYVQPDKFKTSGTCRPSSYPIAAPCGQVNYKSFYFQCTGDLNFEFCDKIMADLEITINNN